MSETQPGQQHVTQVLTKLGFNVNPVMQGTSARHADLEVLKDGIRTVLEIKSRLDDPIFKALSPEIVPMKAQEYSAPTGKTGAFSKRVKDAASQLDRSAAAEDFRCLWFIIAEPQLADVPEQIIGTLLGRRHLLGGKDADTPGEAYSEPCYVLGRADFARFPQIDAAVIDRTGSAMLVSNVFSPRYSKFSNWPLYNIFCQRDAVKDILSEERANKAYIVPTEAKVASDQDILEFVKSKYDLSGQLFFFDPVTHGAITRLS